MEDRIIRQKGLPISSKSKGETHETFSKFKSEIRSGSGIDYVWHENHGSTEPIWLAEEPIKK